MADPFQRMDPQSGAMGRLMRSRRSAALDAIEDLLAQAGNLREVSCEHVQDICSKHGLESPRRIPRDRKRLYQRYLEHCFEDRVLSEEEDADLTHLRELLHLDAREVTAVHQAVAREVYGAAVEEVLEDMRLDPEEEAFLRRLRGDLHLSDRDADRLLETGAQEARTRAIQRATTQDAEFVEHRMPAGEFTGRSQESFEGAITDALAKACLAIPSLHWFEVAQIAGYVEDGRASGWHVTVRAGIKKET
jgi:flavin-binding protein dodecin